MLKNIHAQTRSTCRPLSLSSSPPFQLRFQFDPLNESGEDSQFEFEHFRESSGLLGGPYV